MSNSVQNYLIKTANTMKTIDKFWNDHRKKKKKQRKKKICAPVEVHRDKNFLAISFFF